MRASRFLRSSAALLIVGVMAAACSGGGAAEGVDPGERRDAIRAARSTLGEPAVALVTSADVAETAVTLLREELPDAPDRRRSLADAVVAEDVAPLLQTIREAQRVSDDLAAGEPTDDVARALDAFRDAIEAATSLHGEVRAELDRIVRAADADEELADIVSAWAQGGSRSELLNRFAELAERAQAIATDLEDAAVTTATPTPTTTATEATDDGGAASEPEPTDLVPPCSGAVARRHAAAVALAEASEELRQLVLTRRGNDLDVRLEELVDDPYGTGRALVELDRDDAGCWADSDAVAGATATLTASIDELEAALNPADLSEPPTS